MNSSLMDASGSDMDSMTRLFPGIDADHKMGDDNGMNCMLKCLRVHVFISRVPRQFRWYWIYRSPTVAPLVRVLK